MSSTVTSSGSRPCRAPPRSRRGPRAAPARCRRARAARRRRPRSRERVHLLALVSATPYSLTERPAGKRPFAQLRRCVPPTREVLEQVAELLLRHDPEVDLQAGVGEHACAPHRRSRRSPREPVRGERLGQRRRVVGGRDQVEVLAGLGPAPRRAGDLDLFGTPDARAGRRRISLRDRQHVGEQQPLAGPSSVTPSSEARMFSSVFGPRPESRDAALLRPPSFSSSRFSTPISS